MTKLWPGQNTVPPNDLILHYQGNGTWRRARFFYETWRKTTGLVDPPSAWDELDARMQIALCAVAEVAAEDARDSD